MENAIPFNLPYVGGKETVYINDVLSTRKLSGNGKYTNFCQNFFQEKYGFKKCLLTTSCTDALEMSAILLNLNEGDEVIMPSYTFVSTANAFILRGAKIVFADSMSNNPNMDANLIESLITKNTKAIVVVHYAGVSCDMETIMALALKYSLFVIEDAAQAIDSIYTFKDGSKKALGGIGHLGCISFHETKNIISGEGGMLIVNEENFIRRSEIIWEKGTNRSEFFRGLVDKYSWVDIGSSFLMSEINAAFLWGQLQDLDKIQKRRFEIWNMYFENLSPELSRNVNIFLPDIPDFASNNAHMFYIVLATLEQRDYLMAGLKTQKIATVFHYLSLHNSPFYKEKHDGRTLSNSDKFSDCLLRLPFYYDLTDDIVREISKNILQLINERYKHSE